MIRLFICRRDGLSETELDRLEFATYIGVATLIKRWTFTAHTGAGWVGRRLRVFSVLFDLALGVYYTWRIGASDGITVALVWCLGVWKAIWGRGTISICIVGMVAFGTSLHMR